MSDANSGAQPADPSSQPLQFDHAVEGDATSASGATATTCASCKAPLVRLYYEVNGDAVCAKCKYEVDKASRMPTGIGPFAKAFVVGGIAAVLGAAIYYGVIALTNFEIGIVAIVIGFMVGWGVRRGAAGGGRRYQVLAVVLTYFAVGLAYTPLLLREAMKGAGASDSTAAIANDSAVVSLAGDPSDDVTAPLSEAAVALDSVGTTSPGKALAIGIPLLLGGSILFIFALPVIAVLGSLPSGLISAFIIGIGMHQAWKMTGAQLATITGPYRLGDADAPRDTPPDAQG